MSSETLSAAHVRRPDGARAARRRRLSARALLYVLLTVMAIPFVFPIWWMVTSSFKTVNDILAFPPSLVPLHPTLRGYSQAFSFQPFAEQYFNSIYISVIVTVVTVVISAMAGYGFARIRFPGQNLLFLVVLAGLLVPSEVSIVPLFQMFNKWGMINTSWPLLLGTSFGAYSVMGTFIMRQFFITLPKELEEAASLDGLGRFGTWWRIAMPLARPAIAAVAIFAFLNVWNLYLEPTVYLSSPSRYTLPEALTHFVDTYGTPMWNTQLAGATMTAIPVLIVFLFAQRQFVEGLAQTGLKG